MALRKCAKCGENKIDWNDKKSFGFIKGDVVCGDCSGKHKSTVSQQTQKEDWKLRGPLAIVKESLSRALQEKGSTPVPQKKGPQPIVVQAPSAAGRNPFAQDAAQRKGGVMKNPKDKRKDGGNKNWRRHMESAQAPTVDWGEVYGGEPYISPKDGPVWLFRKGQKCRWYNAQGIQVGPEQANVAPAIAMAMARGWLEPGGDSGVKPVSSPKEEGAPRFRRPKA